MKKGGKNSTTSQVLFHLDENFNKNNTINLTRFSLRHKNLSSVRFCSAKQTPEIQYSTVIPEENESIPTQNQTGGRINATDSHQNLFMVPSGAVGKLHKGGIKVYNLKTANSLKSITLKAINIMPNLLFQKPSRRSETKDHINVLDGTLRLWEKEKSLLVS